MRQKSMTTKNPAEKAVRDIRRKTRKKYSAEEKFRIVLEGMAVGAVLCEPVSAYFPVRQGKYRELVNFWK